MFSSVAGRAVGDEAVQSLLDWLGRDPPRDVAGVEAYKKQKNANLRK